MPEGKFTGEDVDKGDLWHNRTFLDHCPPASTYDKRSMLNYETICFSECGAYEQCGHLEDSANTKCCDHGCRKSCRPSLWLKGEIGFVVGIIRFY